MSMLRKILDRIIGGKKNTGALLDFRSLEAKIKDYKFREVVATVNAVQWVEKPQSQWRKFPEQNQYMQFSCVAQTVRKMMRIIYYLRTGEMVDFSSSHLYKRRANAPFPGMIGSDALEIARRKGVTLESLLPSVQANDKAIDALKVEEYKEEVGAVFKVPNYLIMDDDIGDIEVAASVVQTTKKGVMAWFFFQENEWNSFVPVIRNNSLESGAPGVLRHSVTIVDYTLWEGKRAVIIEDSAWFGGINRRVITEDFFKARNFFLAYMISFRFDDQLSEVPQLPTPQAILADPNRPRYTFNKDLAFSVTFFTDKDVVALQNILKYEKVFPSNIASSGYFGSITAKAVLTWQKNHGLSDLVPFQGRVVEAFTRGKLNEIYGA